MIEYHQYDASLNERFSNYQKAHTGAGVFIKRWRIARLACECGSEKPSDAHHHDYSRPYVVAFLCPRCHKDAHNKGLRYRLYDLRNLLFSDLLAFA